MGVRIESGSRLSTGHISLMVVVIIQNKMVMVAHERHGHHDLHACASLQRYIRQPQCTYKGRKGRWTLVPTYLPRYLVIDGALLLRTAKIQARGGPPLGLCPPHDRLGLLSLADTSSSSTSVEICYRKQQKTLILSLSRHLYGDSDCMSLLAGNSPFFSTRPNPLKHTLGHSWSLLSASPLLSAFIRRLLLLYIPS